METSPKSSSRWQPNSRPNSGKDWKRDPVDAVGLYSYVYRMSVGMKQLLAGMRKFRLDLVSREDLEHCHRLQAKSQESP